MKNITSVYVKYEIPSNLQEHMLRVAAVGKIIADNWEMEGEIKDDFLIPTLLVHDMGNIIKFDLTSPLQIATEDIDWLRRVQQRYIDTYGNDEHYATAQIARDLNLPKPVVDMLDARENDAFHSSTHYALVSQNWSLKIKEYADLRVGPYSLVTVKERFDDVLDRYKGRSHKLGNVEYVEERRKDAYELENQIQSRTRIDLQKLSIEEVDSTIEDLRYFVLPSAKH